MNSEWQLLGALLAFEQIVQEEMDSLGDVIDDLVKLHRQSESIDCHAGVSNALDRVRFIQRQCANVLGHLPSPAPLEPGKEV